MIELGILNAYETCRTGGIRKLNNSLDQSLKTLEADLKSRTKNGNWRQSLAPEKGGIVFIRPH